MTGLLYKRKQKKSKIKINAYTSILTVKREFFRYLPIINLYAVFWMIKKLV